MRVERVTEPVIAGPSELGVSGWPGLDRDGGLAGVGGEGAVGGATLASVADLGEHRGGAAALQAMGNASRRGPGRVESRSSFGLSWGGGSAGSSYDLDLHRLQVVA